MRSPREAVTAFCCNCKEDFALAREGVPWRMGLLFPLARAPRKIRERFASWRDHEEGAYLCGNCLFDLTDED